MSEFDLNQMNDLQFDVLKEIGNIGAGNATTALSQMMNMKIDMGVPNVALVPLSEIAGIIGSEEMIIVGILLGMQDDIEGTIMFLLNEKSANTIVKQLMGQEEKSLQEFGEMEMSALCEIGNIITGAYLSALSSLTNMTISATVPAATIDMAGAILSVPAIEFGEIGDKILMIQTEFSDEKSLNGYFILVPDLESYDKILSALGM